MLICFWRGRSTPAIRAMLLKPPNATGVLAVSFERCASSKARWSYLAARGSPLALPLPLFMFRVHADHPHHALAMDDLALVTNLLNRCPYLHNPALSRQLSAFSTIYL